MNGILGFTELLTQPKLSGQQKEQFIEIIQKSGQRMLNTVNDIIEISKIETGQIISAISKTDIVGEMKDLHAFFLTQTEKKGIEFVFENPDCNTIEFIETDQVKFTSILSNLIKNAIKYTDEGQISIGYQKTINQVEFYVKDTGIGIPKHRQQAIFDRFIQADIADKRAFQGSGLGLSISKSYVEMLGGTIRVESQEGKGSVFYFTLPFSDKIQLQTAIEPKKETLMPHKKLKFLIAEDDKPAQIYFSAVLKEYSLETLIANSGAEAIKMVRENPDIDLILMDIKMPDIDGNSATKEIRKFNKDVIIIAQTANALASDKETALKAGCNDYIIKPVAKKKLLEMIYRHTEL